MKKLEEEHLTERKEMKQKLELEHELEFDNFKQQLKTGESSKSAELEDELRHASFDGSREPSIKNF